MIRTEDLFDLEKTIAKELLQRKEYAWEILDDIKTYIIELGSKLSEDTYDKFGENIWIAKTAKISESAEINGPCIIDENAEIRHCAYIRGNVIVGKNTVVGNSTELKNCILFDDVQVPHFNYVGDSVLGNKAHIGAGAHTSNLKNDKSNIDIKIEEDNVIHTGMNKLGAIIGDCVEIGCNSVLCPGTVICKNVNIYPLSLVKGVIEPNTVYKNNNEIIKKF